MPVLCVNVFVTVFVYTYNSLLAQPVLNPADMICRVSFPEGFVLEFFVVVVLFCSFLTNQPTTIFKEVKRRVFRVFLDTRGPVFLLVCLFVCFF